MRLFNSRFITNLMLAAVSLFCAGCATADRSLNLAYSSLPKERLDIYHAVTTTKAPVMIYVHGGGWHIGNKDRVHQKPAAFNREGIVFVSVGYPLMPEHSVETQAHSLALAIRWLIDHVEHFNGDPGQIHLMGHSSGAHLVGLVVADDRYFSSQKIDARRIKSIINVDGATWNIPWRMQNLASTDPFPRRMFRQTFGNDEKLWSELSPFHHLDENTYMPPVLFLLAEKKTADNLRSDQVVERLLEIGASNCTLEIENRNHATINRKMGTQNDEAFSAIVSFIETEGDCIE